MTVDNNTTSMSSTNSDENSKNECEEKISMVQTTEQKVISDNSDDANQQDQPNPQLPVAKECAEQQEEKRKAKNAKIARETRDFATSLFDFVWSQQKFYNPAVEEAFVEGYSSRLESYDKNKPDHFKDDIGKAVKVTQFLLREYLKNFFRFTVSKKSFISDVKWILMHWLENRDNIFVKIIDMCAILTEAFLFCDYMQNDCLLLSDVSKLFVEWFEENFAEEFFRKGGWKQLANISDIWYSNLYRYFQARISSMHTILYFKMVYNCKLLKFLRLSPVAFPVQEKSMCKECCNLKDESHLYRNDIYMRPLTEVLDCLQTDEPTVENYSRPKPNEQYSAATLSVEMSLNKPKRAIPNTLQRVGTDIEYYDYLTENYNDNSISFLIDSIKGVKSKLRDLGLLEHNVNLTGGVNKTDVKTKVLQGSSTESCSPDPHSESSEDKLKQTLNSSANTSICCTSEDSEASISERIEKINESKDELDLKNSVKIETSTDMNALEKDELPVKSAPTTSSKRIPSVKKDILRKYEAASKVNLKLDECVESTLTENKQSLQCANSQTEKPMQDSSLQSDSEKPKYKSKLDWAIESWSPESSADEISSTLDDEAQTSAADCSVEAVKNENFINPISNLNDETEELTATEFPSKNLTVEVLTKDIISVPSNPPDAGLNELCQKLCQDVAKDHTELVSEFYSKNISKLSECMKSAFENKASIEVKIPKPSCSNEKDKSSGHVSPKVIISEALPSTPLVKVAEFKNVLADSNLLKSIDWKTDNMDLVAEAFEEAYQDRAEKFSEDSKYRSDILVSRIDLPADGTVENLMSRIDHAILGPQPSFVNSDQNNFWLLSDKYSNSFESLSEDIQKRKAEIESKGEASARSVFEDSSERNLETMRFAHCEFKYYLLGKLPKQQKKNKQDKSKEQDTPKKKKGPRKKRAKRSGKASDCDAQNEEKAEPRKKYSSTKV